jgi:hypothetical protein
MKDKLRNTGCPVQVAMAILGHGFQYHRYQLRLRLCHRDQARAYGESSDCNRFYISKIPKSGYTPMQLSAPSYWVRSSFCCPRAQKSQVHWV